MKFQSDDWLNFQFRCWPTRGSTKLTISWFVASCGYWIWILQISYPLWYSKGYNRITKISSLLYPQFSRFRCETRLKRRVFPKCSPKYQIPSTSKYCMSLNHHGFCFNRSSYENPWGRCPAGFQSARILDFSVPQGAAKCWPWNVGMSRRDTMEIIWNTLR